MSTDTLDLEAKAFDDQIVERVKNGHIPDLRYVQPCDYFYNNSWRRPYYVKMDYGEIFQLIHSAIQKNIGKSDARVLEVGCGPGFMTLELARAGYDVVGLDLSPQCIDVARKFAAGRPDSDHPINLHYSVGDFFSNEDVKGKFDAIVFVGALHHFPDQKQVMDRCLALLSDNGIVLAHEPTRDRVERKNAAIFTLIKSILATAGIYFQDVPEFGDTAAIDRVVTTVETKMKYETEDGNQLQSVNDNAAGFSVMINALRGSFTELDFQDRYSFYHELIGGLRSSEEQNEKLANCIRLFDKYLCESGIISPTEFFFAGKKKI